MKLDELHIRHRRTGAIRHGNAVACCRWRIRSKRVQPRAAAGRQYDSGRTPDRNTAVFPLRFHPDATAVFDQQVNHLFPLDDRHTVIQLLKQKRNERLSGLVAAGMQNAAEAVPALKTDRNPA